MLLSSLPELNYCKGSGLECENCKEYSKNSFKYRSVGISLLKSMEEHN